MDILAKHGELSPEDLAEVLGLEKDELVALVIGMNKGWYQLLEDLEDAHRRELKQLEERLTTQLSDSLNSMREAERGQLDGFSSQLASSGKEFTAGLKASKANGERLEALKSTLDKLTNGRAAGR